MLSLPGGKRIPFSRKISRNHYAARAPTPSFHSWRALSRYAGDQRRCPLQPSSPSNALPRRKRRNGHSWSGSNTENRRTLAPLGTRKSNGACVCPEDEPPNPNRLGAPPEGDPRNGGRNSGLPIHQGAETTYAKNWASCRLAQNVIRSPLSFRVRSRLRPTENELHDGNRSKGQLLRLSEFFGADFETRAHYTIRKLVRQHLCLLARRGWSVPRSSDQAIETIAGCIAYRAPSIGGTVLNSVRLSARDM